MSFTTFGFAVFPVQSFRRGSPGLPRDMKRHALRSFPLRAPRPWPPSPRAAHPSPGAGAGEGRGGINPSPALTRPTEGQRQDSSSSAPSVGPSDGPWDPARREGRGGGRVGVLVVVPRREGLVARLAMGDGRPQVVAVEPVPPAVPDGRQPRRAPALVPPPRRLDGALAPAAPVLRPAGSRTQARQSRLAPPRASPTRAPRPAPHVSTPDRSVPKAPRRARTLDSLTWGARQD